MPAPIKRSASSAVKKMDIPSLARKPSPYGAKKPVMKRITAPAPTVSTKIREQVRPRLQRGALGAGTLPEPPRDAILGNPKVVNPETVTISKADGTVETLIEGRIMVEDGIRYEVVRNDEGQLFKKNVTGQCVPPGISRVMSPTEITAYSMRHAEEQLSKLGGVTGDAVLLSLMGGR
jgi:hypothetical protein